ncbi:MAG: hypothetical protein VYE15_06275 [Myxococcota bacterium]|nr:hypothetical protein [Myxococcota bacterium]
MSEPTSSTRDDLPVLALVELEVKRALDRKATPALEAVLGEVRFLTHLDLTLVSGDEEEPGQSEVLEVRYGLTVDGGALPEEHSELWDRLTDVFYGYDDEVGAIVDLYLVRDICNGVDLDGFCGQDLDGFREPTFGASVMASPTEMFQSDWEKAHQRPTPRAITECAPDLDPGSPPMGNEDLEGLARHLIAAFASINDLTPIDPELIEGSDTLFSLMGYRDDMTTGLSKSLLLQADIIGMTPGLGMITVDCAVRVLTELLGDRNASLDDRLRPHGVFEMSAGERKEYLGCGMVCVECKSAEPDGDGTKKTFGLEFQCDESPVVTYRIGADGTAELLSYTDEDGNSSIQDNRYYGEMMEDLTE